jgi:hypothetical protein
MVSMCLFWCLWKEVNDKNFEDRERRTLDDILFMFFDTLYFWMTAFVSPLSFSFNDLLLRFTHFS